MIIENFNPHSLDWTQIPAEKILGETGFALSKIQLAGNIKIRMVEYSKDYLRIIGAKTDISYIFSLEN